MADLPPDVNIGPSALAANWTEAGVAFVIVALRMYAQIFVVGHVALDDYLIVLSWLTGATNTALVSRAIYHGIGRHIIYLKGPEIVQAVKYEILAQPWGIVSPTLSRISFALFLLKFAGQRKLIRWSLWSVIIVQAVANLATIIQILVQCHHLASMWDPTVEGYCMSPRVQVIFGYVQGGINCIHDLMLTFLPIAILKDLNMQMRVKIILIVLMGMSIFGFCASIVKTIMIGSLGSRKDFTFDTIPFILWFTIENYITIITASIPSLRPLFLSLRRRGTSAGNSNSYELNRTGGRPSGYLKQAGSKLDKWEPSGVGSNARSAIQTEIYKYHGDNDASSEENILGMPPYDPTRNERSDAGVNGIKKSVSVTVQYTGTKEEQEIMDRVTELRRP